MNSRELKHKDRNAVLYGSPLLFIQTHEKNIKKKVKNLRKSWKWFSNMKTMNFYFKKYLCMELKGIQ